MKSYYVLLAALATCFAPAHASTITADGVFDVGYRGDPDSGIVDPPYTGSGSFTMIENRIAAFEFSFLGETWGIEDVLSVNCPRSECIVFEGLLDQIRITFTDGFLLWDFHQGIFAMDVLGLHGTSESGAAAGGFTSFESQINLPEPDTLLLLVSGMLGLIVLRPRRQNPLRRRRLPGSAARR